VLREIEAAGLSLLRVPFGIYGIERDKLLAQARLCLNIHFYESAIFESVRCSYLALNDLPVLSEESAGDEGAIYGMQGCAYEHLAKLAAGMVLNSSAREGLATLQHIAVKNVSMVDDIGRALEHVQSTDVARVQVSVPTTLPEITLCMIVKNEATIIERCLESVKPFVTRYEIVDTGSTDGTQDVIRKFMGDTPGNVHDRSWKEFDGSRTEAIDIARKETDGRGWLLLIDADEVLSLGKDFDLPDGFDCYDSLVTRCEECVRWKRPTFIRANKPWFFEMPRHEGLYCREHAPTCPTPAVGCFILSLPDGARAQESEHTRFLRDAKILEEWLKSHPGHSRCQHYLAQSYRDAATGKQPLDRGAMQQAVTHYLRRASMPVFPMEQFSALYRAALCMESCGYPWERVQDTLLRAWNMRPSRAEPLHHLAVYHRGQQQYALAEAFARRASVIPMTSDIFPDVDVSVYSWRAKEELAVALTYLGGHAEALALNREIIEIAHVPDRPRIQANLDMCARIVGG
jgi:glycosyltransferase involved in cell wall biosynthesis